MKKILATFTISVFLVSILGSVSPQLKMKVMDISGDTKYSATSVPVPRMNHSYKYANKKNATHDNVVSDVNNKVESKITDIQFVK